MTQPTAPTRVPLVFWYDKLLFAGSAGGQFVFGWSVVVTPLGTARYRFVT